MPTLVLSSLPLAQYAHATHHRAKALANLLEPVLYVDPPVSPLSLIRHPERRGDLIGPRFAVDPAGLRVWKPTVIPGQNTPGTRAVNARLLRAGIVRHLGAEPALTLTSALETRALLPLLGPKRVYLCDDSFEDIPGVDRAAVRRREDAVIAASDLVAACSLPLCEMLARRGIKAHYVPHGCDPGLARAAEPPDLPAELVGVPRPFVGYVGSLNFRIDPALLKAALEASGTGVLVVVGGAFTSSGTPPEGLAQLLRHPRVVAVGHKPWQALGAWFAALDVGIVPYARGGFNRASYPLKILDYLAAGLPVVSTTNGATDDLGDAVRVADSPEAFGRAVREAIHEGDPASRLERQQVALRRPWEKVMSELLQMAS